jgi:hypothetical protein
MFARLVTVAVSTLLAGVAAFSNATSTSAATTAPCPTGQAGYSYMFWNPYDNWTAAQMTSALASGRAVHDNGVIIDYAVDQEANAAWYPDRAGYNLFESTIPSLLSVTRSSAQPVWMGLIVSPNLFAQKANNWVFLESEVPKFEAVADDLYRQYGTAIQGWYIPTEPGQSNVSTYDLSYQYGVWLRQIDDYLHTHDGNKPVMIAPEMPSAVLSGVSPAQFAREMQPMMAVAHMDVWNFEDGFGMTGWTVAQEAAGFAAAQSNATADHTTVWADVYTPSNSSPAQWEPYLKGIAATGTTTLSQWTFGEYMAPGTTSYNPRSVADYQAYASYCNG